MESISGTGLGRSAIVAGIFLAFGGAVSNGEVGSDWEVHPAFRVELAAIEPVVMDPVDLQFDEEGTAYVMEMGGYPFAPEREEDFPGKLVVIEDTDHDGIFDRRRVFAEHFRYANSILPYRGGVLVASPPDLLWVMDEDGDGRADRRRVMLSGFAVGNSQHNFNGLIYGLDNWIYAGNGGNSGTIFWPEDPENKFPLRHRDMKFDLELGRIEFLGRTTTGFAVALDAWGRVFTTHNMRHINHRVFPDRYVERNPYLTPRSSPDISDHKTGNLDRIYAIGTQEARLNHPEQSGYFSCACGITYYGGGSFPDPFNGNFFVADAVLNLVHRDVVRPEGPGFRAARGRSKVEFLASPDRHSRPVNMRVGPDGALYVVDYYRPVIEHPEWIPDELEKDMDLYAGNNQGRIYRITPREGLPLADPHFDRNRIDKVVDRLEHPNKWWRDTAQRLLVWWNDPNAIRPLEKLVEDSPSPEARVHALWTLRGMGDRTAVRDGLGSLKVDFLRRGLQDPHPGVRENALIMAETALVDHPRLAAAVREMAEDPDARVRMQVALSLGELTRQDSTPSISKVRNALLKILHRDLEYSWTRFAILTALRSDGPAMLEAFLSSSRNEAGKAPPGRREFLQELGELIGSTRESKAVSRAIRAAAHGLEGREEDRLALLKGVNSGLGRGRPLALTPDEQAAVTADLARLQTSASPGKLVRLWEIRNHLGLRPETNRQAILVRSRRQVADSEIPVQERLEHLALLEFAGFDFRRDVLFELLDFRQPVRLQTAAARQLVRSQNLDDTRRLISIWPQLSREVRAVAGDDFIYDATNHEVLLTALENGDLQMGQLNLDLERRRELLRSDRATVRDRARALFSDAGIVTRAEVITRMQPALNLEGRPEKGREHYETLCQTCHTIGNSGYAVGPDLTEIYRKGAATLMHDILDPNAAVNNEYLGYVIEDKSDQILTGIIVNETDEVVVLRASGGLETTFARRDIVSMTSNGLSLMPEGLEAGMSPQDMADLIAYLQEPK